MARFGNYTDLKGLFFQGAFSLDGARSLSIENMMDQGLVSPDGSFTGIEMGIGMHTTPSTSQLTNLDPFETLTESQMHFPHPNLFDPESLNQAASSLGVVPPGSSKFGSMSTADMFRAISDLEQPNRPLAGVRHYGSDAAM